MTIGVDIDDVLADFTSSFATYHNTTFHTVVQREDFHSQYFHEIFGVEQEEMRKKLNYFFTTDTFKHLPVIPGAKEILTKLKNNHSLVAITARGHEERLSTLQWIEREFPDVFSDIFFGNHYGEGERITKRALCDAAGVTLHIDDNPEYVLDCVSDTRPVLLFDQPWNTSFSEMANVRRVRSWQDIHSVIRSLS